MSVFVTDLVEKCLYDRDTRELFLNQSQINGKRDTSGSIIVNLFQHFCQLTRQVTRA